jgi:xanthine/CO dehydrogenase XdhC/CoxF family maturation factor
VGEGDLGLDPGAVDRDETALSIFAEIVAARHARAVGRLKHAHDRIHEIGVEPG